MGNLTLSLALPKCRDRDFFTPTHSKFPTKEGIKLHVDFDKPDILKAPSKDNGSLKMEQKPPESASLIRQNSGRDSANRNAPPRCPIVTRDSNV